MNGEGDGRDFDSGAGAFGNEIEGIAAGVVFVTGNEEFIAGFEAEGTEDGVHAGGRVRNEDQIGRFGADETGDFFAGIIEQAFQFTHEESDGLGFEAVAELLLEFEDGFGAGAE